VCVFIVFLVTLVICCKFYPLHLIIIILLLIIITLSDLLITQADGSRVSIAVIRVCLSVCLFVRSITQKRMTPKSSNLVAGITLGYTKSNVVLGLKGQTSRSHGHKSAKTH